MTRLLLVAVTSTALLAGCGGSATPKGDPGKPNNK